MDLEERILEGRYQLRSLLGVGGMARVYLATDQVLERQVAVKVLSQPYAQDPSFVERFQREARAAARLSHPNIVAVFDGGSDAGLHYLVMEYLPGQSLAELLRRQGRLAPRRAAELGVEVCAALAAAHTRGLVHRDVKPANVLVGADGRVKVTDFGIVKAAATATLTGTGTVLGTAGYLSPEQAQGRPVDGRSDLYSLGCVLYALLTGAPPFAGDSPVAVAARHVTDQPTPPSHHNLRVGPALEAVVLTALAKEPADRYQSAAAMAQDLERVVTTAGASDMPPPDARGEPPTDRLPSVIPTNAATVPTASAALRRPGWIPWALVGSIGVVALVAVALWPRGGDLSATSQATTASTAALPTRPTGTTSLTQSLAELPAALADLGQVIRAGQQQGTVDNSAEDLLKQAEEALRAAQEGKGEDADKKLQDLQRRTDEQIDKGKIRGPAADQVRQAVAQFSQAVRPG